MKTLCIMETYETATGEKKTTWNRIGIMFEGKNGKTYVKLSHIPDTLIHVFDAEKKEAKQSNGPEQEVDF